MSELVFPVFPVQSYPDFAPLSVPMANHLVLQEVRRYRRRISQRPPDQEILQTVLERIFHARVIVFEYMHPFILASKRRQQRGESHTFPEAEWLLEALSQYAPEKRKYDASTLDFWQKKGLLRRERKRGLLDITSVAALLIARLSEGNLQRNFLPTFISEAEPRWWCYGRVSPDGVLQSISVPLVGTFPSSLAVWTSWQGAVWEETMWEQPWQTLQGTDFLYQWARSPSLHDLSIWNKELPAKIQFMQKDPLFGRKAVQEVLLQEAKKDILASIAEKEGHCHEHFIG